MKSKYKANDHLTDMLAQNKRAIEYQREKIMGTISALEVLLEANDYHGYNASLWTEGHVAEEVAHMASLIARQRALIDVQGMIARESKQESEG